MHTLRASGRRWAAAAALAVGAGLAPAGPAHAQALRGLDGGGAVVDLATLRGQAVMLFFWSTGCPVCLDKLPELRRNLAGWKGRPFVIVAVNQDADRADFTRYMALRRQLLSADPQWRDLWRHDPAHRDDFGALPAQSPLTVLLDHAGQVRLRIEGRVAPELWDEVAALVLN